MTLERGGANEEGPSRKLDPCSAGTCFVDTVNGLQCCKARSAAAVAKHYSAVIALMLPAAGAMAERIWRELFILVHHPEGGAAHRTRHGAAGV